MTLSEAKMILETEGEELEEIKDRYETSVFQQIQIFLKDPIIPSLAISRLQKLKNLSEAYLFFDQNNDSLKNEIPVFISLNSIKDWKEFWNTYELNKAVFRKAIVQTYHYADLEIAVNLLVENELEYAKILTKLLVDIRTNSEIKISEPIQIIEIIKECESLRDRNVVDSSIESLKKISDKNVTFNLSKEVNRLRKLLKHG
jgi:hypothetical protein